MGQETHSISMRRKEDKRGIISLENVKDDDIRGLFQSFVEVMTSAIDERTPYNVTHTRHMVEYGERFVDYINQCCFNAGQAKCFDAAHKDEFLMSIWLHDIGKLVTPLGVMNKETRLRPDQLTEILHRMEKVELWTEILMLKGTITEEEKVKRLDEVKYLRDFVESVNHAGVICGENLEILKDIKFLTYKDLDGNEHPWFTEDEYISLMIHRGTLSAQEREIMEEHVLVTDKLLSKIKFIPELSRVREWAAGHHELLDGSGYPNHLSGDQIPYEVRMITILDIFDALIADDRPYKPGIPIEKAVDILTEMAEKEGKLDPRLTKLFIEGCCWEDK